MSAYKKLNKQDAYISTYNARKSWTASGSQYIDLGILNIVGLSGSGTYIPQDINLTFGGGVLSTSQVLFDKRLAFESIHHLYYSLFTSASIPVSSSYENYLQSSFNVSGSRYLYQRVAVFSIPKELYGTHIEPGSLSLEPDITSTIITGSGGSGSDGHNYVLNNYVTDAGINSYDNIYNLYAENTTNLYGSTFPLSDLDYIEDEGDYVLETIPAGGQYLGPDYTGEDPNAIDPEVADQHSTRIVDDGEGNLYFESSLPRKYVGNIIYPHGQIIITDDIVAGYFNNYFNATLNWKSNLPIYTHNYHCKLKSGELNHTLNKTALDISSGEIAPNISGSDFQPYFTTVGLYNDANELIAVAKMGQPIPKSADTDMVVVAKLDMNFGVNKFTKL